LQEAGGFAGDENVIEDGVIRVFQASVSFRRFEDNARL
jgi:hypothetical protein